MNKYQKIEMLSEVRKRFDLLHDFAEGLMETAVDNAEEEATAEEVFKTILESFERDWKLIQYYEIVKQDE